MPWLMQRTQPAAEEAGAFLVGGLVGQGARWRSDEVGQLGHPVQECHAMVLDQVRPAPVGLGQNGS